MILDTLEKLYSQHEDEVEKWLAAQRSQAQPYLYNSVDLRHSGTRLVPVDTNLFPAGFNNLSEHAAARAARFFRSYLQENYPGARRVLIVPENHTRNLAYLDNLLMLRGILAQAGCEVDIGNLQAEPSAPHLLTALSGREIVQQPLVREGNALRAEGKPVPDIIVLNNDCTGGIPSQLIGLSQPVLPPPQLGWHARRKSIHFEEYSALAKSFCKEFGLDSWLMSAAFRTCGQVDFKDRASLERVAAAVDDVLSISRAKHKEYGIDEEPYVYVKADSGTYGMGIMTVSSGSEMLDLNKKERNKMQVIKEGARVSEVIVQEGVPTIDRVKGMPAEPMIYLVDGIPVGGMYRANGNRDALENLNAAGVEFTGMCDETETVFDCREPVRECHFRPFGLIAALAALAVPREFSAIKRAGAL